ncbi:MAG: hypothetical protein ACRDS0_08065 [Pseudonocardiaceae bacterium]
MSTQQTSSTGVLRAEEVLDLTIAQAREAGRDDLIRRLTDTRRLLVDAPEGEGLRTVANHVPSVLDQLTEMLRFRQSRIVAPGRAAQAQAAARLAEERTESLRGRTGRWQKMLHDSFATITSDVEFDLRERMQAVLAEAEEAIERVNPAKNWDELAAWLRQRLEAGARANHDLAVTSSRTVSQRVAENFTQSEMHIVDPPPMNIPTDLPTGLTAKQALSGSRVSLSTIMGVYFPAYSGLLMFVIGPRLFGFDISPYFGLIPALLMGGIAFIEERKRQLEKRRAQANTTIRNYVTDFTMRVTKESRDLLRQIEQELRGAYGDRTEEIQRSLTDAGNVAYRTLSELEQSQAVLAEIDTSLAHLADIRRRAAAIVPAQLLATSGALR